MTPIDYKKFYVIKAKTQETLHNIHMLRANNHIMHHLGGKPQRVSNLRDCSLLVEVANHKQSLLIHGIKKLGDFEVLVESHGALNQFKVTIRNRTIIRYRDE